MAAQSRGRGFIMEELTRQMFVHWVVIICNQSAANAFFFFFSTSECLFFVFFCSVERFEKLPEDGDQTLDSHHLKEALLEVFVNSVYL